MVPPVPHPVTWSFPGPGAPVTAPTLCERFGGMTH